VLYVRVAAPLFGRWMYHLALLTKGITA
jgi:hypothetical protein